MKNGIHLGRQRYKCKQCGYQFTIDPDISQENISLALGMKFIGLSNQAISKFLDIDRCTVYRWIQKYGTDIVPATAQTIREYIRPRRSNISFSGNDAERIFELLKQNYLTSNSELDEIQNMI